MQTLKALERVAFEFIEDMHADGVVYAEVRFAPVFHVAEGLTQEACVRSVISGLRQGERKYGVRWGLIICAMRDRTDSLEAAELAINFRGDGVVGFDLAGEEEGHPPKRHLEADLRAAQNRTGLGGRPHGGQRTGGGTQGGEAQSVRAAEPSARRSAGGLRARPGQFEREPEEAPVLRDEPAL